MRKLIYVLFFLAAVSFSETAGQADWSGGDGVPGPVTDWSDTYDNSSQIGITSGTLQLNPIILANPVEHTVDGNFGAAISVYATDVDGDGDTDVLGAARDADDITWWENTDGIGTVWVEHTVDGDFDGAYSVYATDVDGDGDTDVLGAAYSADDITWWENTDGTGTVWVEHTVDGDFDNAQSVYATDVDGDGDTDVLGAAALADDITWWENIGGAGTVWVEHTVDGNFDGAMSVYATDVDGDGDTDVLGAAFYANDITWWENIGGAGTVWAEHTVDGNFDGAYSVYAADIDGDGYTDVLGAASRADEFTWWNVLGYDEGTLESSILDAGLVHTWDILLCNSQEPTGTLVAFQVRSSSDAGIMGSWSDTLFTPGAGLSGILADSTQYLQYRVILDTSNPSNTPVLEDVLFSYSTYVSTEENSSGDIASWSLLPPENPSYGHYSAMITVPEPGMVVLALYDVTGRVVAESSQEFPIGTHSVIFEGLAEGVYFCAMRAGEYTATEKVVVLE